MPLMEMCKHLAWVSLNGEPETSIHDEGRLLQILRDLTDPNEQRPSLIFFVGRKAKNVALRELFPYNNIKRGRQNGLANIRADTTTLNSSFPILFADSDVSFKLPVKAQETTCHERFTYRLQWQPPPQLSYSDIIHARLFFLFTDVICIFADDFASLDDVVKRLKSWTAAGSISSSPRIVRPKVVIVLRGDDASATFNIIQAQDLRFNLNQQDLIDYFSSIVVLYLADEQISPLARHRRLKEVILRHVDEIRQLRQSAQILYSATHLARFAYEALQHLSRSRISPFNFINVSRMDNMVQQDYCAHIVRFLRLGAQHCLSDQHLSSYIASSMVMDAFPPAMHYFEPRLIYNEVYKPFLIQAFRTLHGISMAESHSRRLQHQFSIMTSVSTDRSISTVQVHQENIRMNLLQWSRLRSNSTCLSCLRRRPEHTLTCGHALCDVCVQLFGCLRPSAGHQYYVQSCPLCRAGSLVVTLKPPTAGVRILTIDGGGIRGVIPLEFLRILQSTIGPGCAVQDLFDLAFGTSSGGLIVLSLFVRRWNLSYCAEIFDTLTRQFFRRRIHRSGNLVQQIRHLLKCWLSDGYYDVVGLEKSLKEYFGTGQRMFDYTADPSDVKVGVTATTISDASAYLFSNYNGSSIRSSDCGYKHLRPEHTEDEPYVWEAGRVTSAAPGLFRPAHIAAIGTFQDGGLKHNNPINLALWESVRIWPSIAHPDVVLSLGTGTEKEAISPGAPDFRHIFQDGFIPRLYRSFISSLDGQGTWRDLQNRLNQKSRKDYFRLNVALSKDQWTIDDTAQMSELRKQVHLQSGKDQEFNEIAFALMTSSFFFELTRAPIFTKGSYRCEGTIRSRLQSVPVEQLLKGIHSTWMFITDTENLGYYEPQYESCAECHRYEKHVEFSVRLPTDSITIYIQSAANVRRKISGFPQTIVWFATQQHLVADFGAPNHGNPTHQPCKACNILEPRPSLKRKSSGEDSKEPKARRKSRDVMTD